MNLKYADGTQVREATDSSLSRPLRVKWACMETMLGFRTSWLTFTSHLVYLFQGTVHTISICTFLDYYTQQFCDMSIARGGNLSEMVTCIWASDDEPEVLNPSGVLQQVT
jgi:hypothetical protein